MLARTYCVFASFTQALVIIMSLPSKRKQRTPLLANLYNVRLFVTTSRYYMGVDASATCQHSCP